MQTRTCGYVLVAALAGTLCGCAAISGLKGEEDASSELVALSEVPLPARMTIERLIAGGEIRKLEKEEVGGDVIYDVEATVAGKDVEYDVASDGTVLSAEESVPYASLPGEVRAAVEEYFGSAAGLKAFTESEGSETFYEVEGRKGNAAITLKLTDAGRIVEEEQE